MNREVHVRFWEGLAVRFRWTTQLSYSTRAVAVFRGGALSFFDRLPTSMPKKSGVELIASAKSDTILGG
jgi:hypothetical protein